MSNKEPFFWDRFLAEGDILFNYMTSNFTNMFDGISIIKHFDISPGIWHLANNEYDELKDKYGYDIEQKLIVWINNENDCGSLFNKELWKPFRDQEHLNYMYLGYKKMFIYNEYYLQLVIDKGCNHNNCIYCNENMSIQFQLLLYGWKIPDSIYIQPDNCAIIQPDNIMPEYYWNIK